MPRWLIGFLAILGVLGFALVPAFAGKRVALVIGNGIAASLVGACFFGLSVPAGLHALKLDPKIAAGPITLALTDVLTLIVYFGLAAIVLG